MEQEAVVIKDLSKSFGSVQANRNISIDVRRGEILALLGENGSGKSTLVNMSSILQGIIIFFVLGSEFFVKYKLFFAKRAKKNVIDTNTAEVAK